MDTTTKLRLELAKYNKDWIGVMSILQDWEREIVNKLK